MGQSRAQNQNLELLNAVQHHAIMFGKLTLNGECWHKPFRSYVYNRSADDVDAFLSNRRHASHKRTMYANLIQTLVLRLLPKQMLELAYEDSAEYLRLMSDTSDSLPIRTNRYELATLMLNLGARIDKPLSKKRIEERKALAKKFCRTLTNDLLTLGSENFRDPNRVSVGGYKADGSPREVRTTKKDCMDIILAKDNYDLSGNICEGGRGSFVLWINKKSIHEQWEDFVKVEPIAIEDDTAQPSDNQEVTNIFLEPLTQNLPQFDINILFKEKEVSKIENFSNLFNKKSQATITRQNGSKKQVIENFGTADENSVKKSTPAPAAPPTETARIGSNPLAQIIAFEAKETIKLAKNANFEEKLYAKTVEKKDAVTRLTDILLSQIISTLFGGKQFDVKAKMKAHNDLERFVLDKWLELQTYYDQKGKGKRVYYDEMCLIMSDEFIPFLQCQNEFEAKKGGLFYIKEQNLISFCSYALDEKGKWKGGGGTFRAKFENEFAKYRKAGKKMHENAKKETAYQILLKKTMRDAPI